VDLDPTWGKYAALQVAGVGYSIRIILFILPSYVELHIFGFQYKQFTYLVQTSCIIIF